MTAGYLKNTLIHLKKDYPFNEKVWSAIILRRENSTTPILTNTFEKWTLGNAPSQSSLGYHKDFFVIIQSILLRSYKIISQSSFFQTSFAKSLFIYSYFKYKKYIEDAFHPFFREHHHKIAPGHFLDIGANIGYTSSVFSEFINPQFQVHAFEPEKENITLLKKVINKKISKNIVVNGCACGETSGVITLWKNHDQHADHRIATDAFKAIITNEKACYEVPMLALDDYALEKNILNSISFVKIDVQGFELSVLKGMNQIIEQNPKIVIAFEYGPKQMKDLGFLPQELISFFAGFHFYILKRNGQIIKTTSHEIISHNDPNHYLDIVVTKFHFI